MKKLLLICLCLTLFNSTAKGEEKKLSEIAKRRFESATKAYHAWLAREKKHGGSVETVYNLSLHVVKAERELNPKKESQLSALKAHLTRMQDLEKMIIRKVAAAEEPAEAALLLTVYLTEAEYWLMKAQTD